MVEFTLHKKAASFFFSSSVIHQSHTFAMQQTLVGCHATVSDSSAIFSLDALRYLYLLY